MSSYRLPQAPGVGRRGWRREHHLQDLGLAEQVSGAHVNTHTLISTQASWRAGGRQDLVGGMARKAEEGKVVRGAHRACLDLARSSHSEDS